MTFKDFSESTKRTMVDLKDSDKNIYHALFGMQTELGEITDLYKKKLAYNKHFSKEQLMDEVGDLLFYISEFLRFTNLDIETILQKNSDKLKVRFPEKFEEARAVSPNKEEEMKVFNN